MIKTQFEGLEATGGQGADVGVGAPEEVALHNKIWEIPQMVDEIHSSSCGFVESGGLDASYIQNAFEDYRIDDVALLNYSFEESERGLESEPEGESESESASESESESESEAESKSESESVPESERSGDLMLERQRFLDLRRTLTEVRFVKLCNPRELAVTGLPW